MPVFALLLALAPNPPDCPKAGVLPEEPKLEALFPAKAEKAPPPEEPNAVAGLMNEDCGVEGCPNADVC